MMEPDDSHACASQREPFRVLALDGGGIRGYYTARLLERLVEGAGGDPQRADVGRAFDLIVGTSTGALIAAALASGLSVTRISSLYRDQGPAIFPRPAPIGWTSLAWCGLHWRRPGARADALRAALAPLFGSTTFGELHARRGIALCVTVTDVRAVRARVLATPHEGTRHATPDIALTEACLASCAAPILMPAARLPVAGDAQAHWCDGGLWATSPILAALDEALAIAPAERPIEIVSAGTCAMPVPASVIARPPGTGIGMWVRGLRAVQVTGDAQARAAVDSACRLAAELRREVRVVRLREPAPTDDDAAVVRLDTATPRAFAVMERLALAAAELNRATSDPAGDGAHVATLFAQIVAASAIARAAQSSAHALTA